MKPKLVSFANIGVHNFAVHMQRVKADKGLSGSGGYRPREAARRPAARGAGPARAHARAQPQPHSRAALRLRPTTERPTPASGVVLPL